MLPESQMSGSRNHLEGGCYIIAQRASARSVSTLRSRATFPSVASPGNYFISLLCSLAKITPIQGINFTLANHQAPFIPVIVQMENRVERVKF